MATLEAFIDAPSRHKDLTVFPVVAPRGPELHYLLSTEIGEEDVLTLRDRGDDTSPMLLARNNSYHDLLVLAGEPLPGNNGGRIVNRSFLIAGKSVIQIPAPSVEPGASEDPAKEAEITDWVERFPIQKRQAGLLAFLGPRVLGLELLGSPGLYEPLHRRLLIRFIREAIPFGEAGLEEDRAADLGKMEAEARQLVTTLDIADRVETKRVGAADYLKLKGPVTGAELVHQGTLLHLSVRPAPVQIWADSRKEG